VTPSPVLKRLIGFDIRWLSKPGFLDFWDEPRRQQYLIRPEVAYPLSIDRHVWPSRFSLPGLLEPVASVADLDGVAGGQHFDTFAFWANLTDMVSNYRPAGEPDCVIGVALLIPQVQRAGAKGPADPWRAFVTGQHTDPDEPGEKWVPLGCDVANDGYLSGLSNCGMFESERQSVRGRWSASLNEFGLFNSPETAQSFCDEANTRLKEDGPFHVFELFLISGDLRR
jgi:hypothetical protein